ncbi:hypothetical protein N3K66_006429 [Trichothecium roseum]|uniref:Uncharacterized protein n=1 Tax=Trichothecium roseum TaxID=47278 RepID=A0ACC0UVC6_9HYPO|nr:hypothetical protein N3K66_006429 [Trichothecium roseum]
MRESECAGDVVQFFFELGVLWDDRRWATASRSFNMPSSHFTNGRRSLWERAITLPTGPAIPFVSGCEMFGRFYISAIELETDDGTHLCLGYRHAASKTPLCPGKVVITGFCLAEDERGLRGISVLSVGGITSEWVGERHGLSKRMLVLSSAAESKVGHLKGGFDALKFVSLSISHQTPPQLDPGDSMTIRDSTSWFPDIPDVRVSFAGIKERAATAHAVRSPLCLALPPAPPAAEGWPRIRQARADINDKGYIVCLDVHYSNQDRAVRLELENAFPHQTIILDMDSDDEQIVSADAFYEYRGTFVGSKLYTNLGRLEDFTPGIWGNYRGTPTQTRSFSPRNGRLVGFCSRVNRWTGLTDIGFAHVPN